MARLPGSRVRPRRPPPSPAPGAAVRPGCTSPRPGNERDSRRPSLARRGSHFLNGVRARPRRRRQPAKLGGVRARGERREHSSSRHGASPAGHEDAPLPVGTRGGQAQPVRGGLPAAGGGGSLRVLPLVGWMGTLPPADSSPRWRAVAGPQDMTSRLRNLAAGSSPGAHVTVTNRQGVGGGWTKPTFKSLSLQEGSAAGLTGRRSGVWGFPVMQTHHDGCHLTPRGRRCVQATARPPGRVCRGR